MGHRTPEQIGMEPDGSYAARLHIIESIDGTDVFNYRSLNVPGLEKPNLDLLEDVPIFDHRNGEELESLHAVSGLAIVDFPSILISRKPTVDWLNAELTELYEKALLFKKYKIAAHILGGWVDVNMHSTHFVTDRDCNGYNFESADKLAEAPIGSLNPLVVQTITRFIAADGRRNITPAILAVSARRK